MGIRLLHSVAARGIFSFLIIPEIPDFEQFCQSIEQISFDILAKRAMKFKRQSIIIEGGIIFILFGLFILYGSRKIETVPFHIDEAHKISETYYYTLFFVKHDFSNPDWQNDFYARINPPVAKYLMGMYLGAHGQSITDLSLQQKFEQFWKTPEILASQVPKSLLMNARFLMVVFSALTLVLVYLIGRLSGSILAGILGALFLACNPFFQYYGTVALTDTILLFFMSSVVVITPLTLKHFLTESMEPKNVVSIKSAVFFLLSVIAIVGAAGTKLNGALSGIFFIAVFLSGLIFQTLRSNVKSVRKMAVKNILLMTGIILVSVIVFIAINPYLYHHPLLKIKTMLAVYSDWMVKQAIDPGQPLWTGIQKLTSIGYYNFTVPQRVFGNTTIPFLFVLFCIGLADLIFSFIAIIRKGQFPFWHTVVFSWTLVYGFGIGIWIPVTWDRYFFPLTPCIAVVTSLGIVTLVNSFKKLRDIPLLISNPTKTFVLKSTAIVGSISIALLLWYFVMDRSLVPPSVFINSYKPEIMNAWYEEAQLKHPEEPLRMIYTADINNFCKKPIDASILYEKAASALEKTKPFSTRARVMLALAQLGLSEAYFNSSRFSACKEMLEKHIQTLDGITQTLKTNNPKVLNEFNRTIKEREDLLSNLGQSGNHTQ